jgi:hypothetical protein
MNYVEKTLNDWKNYKLRILEKVNSWMTLMNLNQIMRKNQDRNQFNKLNLKSMKMMKKQKMRVKINRITIYITFLNVKINNKRMKTKIKVFQD